MTMLTPWTLSPTDLERGAADLVERGIRADVIIPAKNEAATIGAVIDAVREHESLVGELIVVNDQSDDDTATVAARHGATVLTTSGPSGKGQALQVGVAATSGSHLVFLDADVLNISSHFLPRLLAPFALRTDVALVKGYYVRPLHYMPTGGGRVNELAALPILSLLYPGLGEVRQPLAGETALRRDVVDRCGLSAGYSIEIALLLDVARHYGISSVAQVDLGIRRHRNRPLEELGPMATEVLRTALTRFGVTLPND